MSDTARSVPAAGAADGGPRTGRILAVDAARALAIVGMVTVNVGPTETEEAGSWLYLLPHGRASILFVLLAGIGFSLMTRSLRQARDRDGATGLWRTLAWRCLLLLLGGLALQDLGHEVNVILPVYALLFVVAGLLVRAGDRVLLAVAALGVTAGPVVWLAPQVASGVPYSGVPAGFGDPPAEVLHSVVLGGPYPLVTWVAPFALGMWLGRRDLTDPALQRRAALVAGAVAVVAPALARTLVVLRGGLVGDLSWELLLTDADHGQMPLWLLGATAICILVLVGCLTAERWMRRRPLRLLVTLGQLSLTFYVAHLFALAWLRPLPHDLAQGVVISTAMVAAAVVGAWAWRRHRRRGPLETLLRPPSTWRT